MSPSAPPSVPPASRRADPFARVRARGRARAWTAAVAGALSAALLAGAWVLLAPAPDAVPVAAPLVAPASSPAAGVVPSAPAAPSPPEPVSPYPWSRPDVQPLPATGFRYITVDTRGYQQELDQCLWVRMDLGAVAPIVGAHNYCGGDIVLDLQPGDRVYLVGQGLDGAYRVDASRDGYPGQPADEATAGLTASVILQTCYWTSGDVRLLALVPLRAEDLSIASGAGG